MSNQVKEAIVSAANKMWPWNDPPLCTSVPSSLKYQGFTWWLLRRSPPPNLWFCLKYDKNSVKNQKTIFEFFFCILRQNSNSLKLRAAFVRINPFLSLMLLFSYNSNLCLSASQQNRFRKRVTYFIFMMTSNYFFFPCICQLIIIKTKIL